MSFKKLSNSKAEQGEKSKSRVFDIVDINFAKKE